MPSSSVLIRFPPTFLPCQLKNCVLPENKSKSVDPSISLIDSNTKIENSLEIDKEHGIVDFDKADFIESIKEKLFSKEQKKVDNEAAI